MSQVESHKTIIDEHSFEMFMLPPRKSNKLLIAFSKMLGPSFSKLTDSLVALSKGKSVQDILNQDIDVGKIFENVFSTFFNDLDSDVIDLFMSEFAVVTHADNAPLDRVFDLFFLGKLDLMYKWFVWGIKVQWGKSLSALVNVAKNQGAHMVANQSQSQSL